MSASIQQQFTTWVRSKPADEVFDPWNGHCCAGFQFLSEAGYPVQFCAIFGWDDLDGKTHEFPDVIRDAIHWSGQQADAGRGMTFGALLTRLEASA